ncbi:hypothetical protein [Hominifimenecus sp. rT4P-3]|uniref:hypothetical protein n=1 Tax=Hominifimenecus sp. rT4P-3 TaxID=3242979 RepID=UPI003DA5B3D9
MGERALENRVKKLKEIEAQVKALEEQAEALKAEIKQDMEQKGQEEIKAGSFVVRWKTIISSKFDSKTFKAEHEALYNQYARQISGRRFTVA